MKGSLSAYLAPHKHRPENNLKAVEKIVSDYDDGRSARRPSFTWAYRLNAWSRCKGNC